MPITDCIWCSPWGICGPKRVDGKPFIECNPQGCQEYDRRATAEQVRKKQVTAEERLEMMEG